MDAFLNAGLSDSDIGEIIRALVYYDTEGIIPKFDNPVLIGFFYIAKQDIDEKGRRAGGKQ
jgi:hypothetical protein